MANRRKELTAQVVVRVDERMHDFLKEDAEANGRTIAQTIRFLLSRMMLNH